MTKQQTISKQIHFSGVGLHNGEKSSLVLYPAPENYGVMFKKDGVYIEANATNIYNTTLSTCLKKNGVVINTVEHIMSAIHGAGIDNIIIEITGNEIPIMDGSSKIFYEELKNHIVCQNIDKKYMHVTDIITFKKDDQFITIEPSDDFSITFTICFPEPINNQVYTFNGDYNEIYKAKTFCFLKDVEYMQKNNLALGGSEDNALIIGNDGTVINNDIQSYNNEFVRHKILDCIGDIFLCGHNIKGKITCHKSGHYHTSELVKRILLSNYEIRE